MKKIILSMMLCVSFFTLLGAKEIFEAYRIKHYPTLL